MFKIGLHKPDGIYYYPANFETERTARVKSRCLKDKREDVLGVFVEEAEAPDTETVPTYK